MKRLLSWLLLSATCVALSANGAPSPPCAAAFQTLEVFVSCLGRVSDQGDASALAALADGPLLVGMPESDNVRQIAPRMFAERFLDEVSTLDLSLRPSAVLRGPLTEPPPPQRVMVYILAPYASLYVSPIPERLGEHLHTFFLERTPRSWRWKGYATSDGKLLEQLWQGLPKLLVGRTP